MTRKRLNGDKFDRKQRQWHSVDQSTIQELASTGRHQECLQGCQQILQSEPENPLPWKYAGKSLLALGQFEKARQCLTKAHQLDTKDPETTKDIGNIFLNLGSTEDATAWYKKSLEINNKYAPALNNIANIKRQSGNNQEAVNLFKQAIQADPQLVQACVGAAASSLALGDFDQAESFAIRAIEINAHARGINEILGIIFQNKKKFQQAVESYQKELIINPKSNTSLLNLGSLLLQQGKATAAIEPLTRAAGINTSEQCLLLLAQAYQNIGKLKEAIIEYKKIDIMQCQNKMIPFNLGLCLLNTGNNIDAIEAFKIAVKIDESFLPAWGNIGNALKNENRYNEALLAIQKVLDLDPDNATAHTNLGSIYRGLGKLDQALASTLKALELKPASPDVHMSLGWIYKELGDLDHALASTLKALELKPASPDIHMNLGWIYKELGDLDQALTSTLKAAERKPDNPDVHMNLAWIYKELGDLDQALTSSLKAAELNPDNPDAYMCLSYIYRELGSFQKALASIHNALEIKSDIPSAHLNLGFLYKNLDKLDQALASTLKSLELHPEEPNALENLGDIYFAMGLFDQSEEAFDCAIKLKSQNEEKCLSGKAACCFERKDYSQSVKILRRLTSVDDPKASPFPKEVQLKALIYEKVNMEIGCTSPGEGKFSPSKIDEGTQYKTSYRPVGDELINELYALDKKKLAHLSEIEARKGEGFCTDYKLFTHGSPNIQQLEIDLREIIYDSLGKESCSLKHDSFFNIFRMGAQSVTHDHLRPYDERFNQWKHKYSLVYYLDPGDQDCEHPGILKMYDPEIELLPKKGLIVIMPASRKHSSFYGGSRDRLMLGVNFYAFTPGP